MNPTTVKSFLNFGTLCMMMVVVLSLPALATESDPVRHHLRATPDNMVWGYFAADTPPKLHIKSGDIVVVDTVSMGRISSENPEQFFIDNEISLKLPLVQEMIAIRREVKPTGMGGHMISGPIFIDGASPGDVLEVRVLEVRSRSPYGINSGRPGAGGISNIVPRPYSRVIRLDQDRQVALLTDGIEIPLRPFQGVMAVAPPSSRGRLHSTPPYPDIGGNLDNKRLVTGSTLYLPVQVEGALFHTGDPHAAQGNGEISNTAIESSNTAVLQFFVHKGRRLEICRAETPTHYICMGFDTDLDAAMQMATLETLKFLREEKGLDPFTALSLGSIGVDFEVTQVVDETKGIHAMIPKSFFVKEGKDYWYSPGASETGR